MSEEWMQAYVAWKAVECLTLRRSLTLLEDAALRLLAEPFSPACRTRMRAQLDATRRDLAAIANAEPPPRPEIPAQSSAETTPPTP